MAHQTCHHKLVLLGETSVGKTCVTIRFVRNEFHEFQEPTIGGTSREKKKKNDSRKKKIFFYKSCLVLFFISYILEFCSSFSIHLSGVLNMRWLECLLVSTFYGKKIRNRSEFFGATRLTLLSLYLSQHHLTLPTHILTLLSLSLHTISLYQHTLTHKTNSRLPYSNHHVG